MNLAIFFVVSMSLNGGGTLSRTRKFAKLMKIRFIAEASIALVHKRRGQVASLPTGSSE